MFASTISFATLLAMLLHAALGCCWHHGHALGVECAGHQVVGSGGVDSHAHGSCPHAVVANSHANHEHDPAAPTHQPCEEGNCTYLSTPLVQAPAPEGETSLLQCMSADLVALTCRGLIATGSQPHRPDSGGGKLNHCILDLTQVCLL